MKNKICASCGKQDTQFVGAFCVNCYSRKFDLFSFKAPALAKCVRCNRYRIGREWKLLSQEELEEMVGDKVSSKLEIKSVKLLMGKHKVKIWVTLETEGNEVSVENEFPFAIEKRLCQDCSLKSGGYHEAIIQLRGTKARVDETGETLSKMLERETFIAKEETKKEGLDLLVGNKRAALGCVSRMGIPYSLSHTLVGVKDGKKLLRVTILMRL